MDDAPVSGGEWMSITEAAARLTATGDPVDRSTLSRYLSQHAEALPTRREGKANLVEFGALSAHRAENVRLRRGPLASRARADDAEAAGGMPGDWQGGGVRGAWQSGTGRAMGQGGAGHGPAGSGGRPQRFAGSQSDGLARKINADAEMREMDLAKRRGELTPTAEVDQAGRDAVALMQAAFDRAVETEAATLSVRYGWDERVTRIALKGFAKRGLEVFNREIRERLDARARASFADDGEAAAESEDAAGAVADAGLALQ